MMIEDQISIKDLDNLLLEEKSTKEKTELDVLKELFSLKDIETKTELSQEQIILFNQKRTIAKMLKWDRLDDCLLDFMLLQVSKNRAGRGEFVDGFKSDRDNRINMNNNPSFWQRLNPFHK